MHKGNAHHYGASLGRPFRLHLPGQKTGHQVIQGHHPSRVWILSHVVRCRQTRVGCGRIRVLPRCWNGPMNIAIWCWSIHPLLGRYRDCRPFSRCLRGGRFKIHRRQRRWVLTLRRLEQNGIEAKGVIINAMRKARGQLLRRQLRLTASTAIKVRKTKKITSHKLNSPACQEQLFLG